jgi:predicted nucleic acid-binding protein
VNVVDSSAWLEYFADTPSGAVFADTIEHPEKLVVPTVTVYEVFRRICQLKDETAALAAAAVMLQGDVVDLNAFLSLDAARLSAETGLSMADSIILATARARNAVLWTQDAHFKDLRGVEYRELSHT